MPDLREVPRDEWEKLPLWDGLSFDDPHGKQYRGEHAGRTFVITVNARRGAMRHSESEEVKVV